MVERVWGQRAPANAVISVRNHVTRIRRAAPGLVLTVGSDYTLHPEVVVRYDPSAGQRVLEDLADGPEVIARRHAIRERLAAEVDDALLDILTQSGAPGPNILEQLRLAVDDEPYRETRWAVFALAQALAGQRRASLLTLQAAREQLAEVGLGPGDRLTRIEASIAGGGTLDVASILMGRRSSVHVAVHPHHDEPFAGRAHELRVMGEAWEATVQSGRPRLLLVDGPAGSGKTRLVDRFVSELLRGPAPPRLMWGRHRATADRAHGAIAESLARLFADEPDLADAATTQQLRRLVALDAPAEHDAAADADIAFARTRLGIELSRLVGAFGRRPTIWLLDDIQWTEPDSLGLLEEAFDAAPVSVMVIVTARHGAPAVADLVATLGRVLPTTVIPLSPLGRDDLGELVEMTTHRVPGTHELDDLHRRTGGLALYVSEILRLARRSGSVELGPVPTAIREWIRHRMAQLDAGTTHILHVAALAADVDLELIAGVTEAPSAEVAAHCDELHAAGFLTLDSHTGALGFPHDMTIDAVCDSIGPVQRLQLERRLAEALLATADDDHDRLAIHFDRAHDDRAFGHALQAADAALAIGASDHARSMAAVAAAHAVGDEQRARALVATGRALLASGDHAAARPYLEDAIGLARRAGAPAPHARAALALVGRAGRGAINDDEHLQLSVLRTVLDHLGETTEQAGDLAALRCDLERELAIALLLSDAAGEREALLRGAFERAQHLDPPQPRTLAAAALGMRYALLGPGDLAARLDHTGTVLAMPAERLDVETRISAWVYRHEDLRRAGDHAAADAALEQAALLLATFPHPYWTWAVRTWEALGHVVAGRLDLAERIATEAFALRPGVTEAAGCLGVTLVDIRLYQGRAGEMVPMLRGAVESHPHIPAYRAVLALCAAEAGDEALARHSIRWFTDHGCAPLPDDTNRFLGLAVLAHAAAAVRDAEAAATLLPLLEPYDGQWVVLSAYGGGGATWGPTAHALARLADVLGDERADGWFASAELDAAVSPLALERIVTDRSAAALPSV